MHKIYTASVNLTNNTYENCQTITQVDLMQTPWVNNSMVDAFNNCSNLHTVTNINSQVTSLTNTFKNCQNLVNAPAIPPNVTNMYETFRWCSNLAEIPILPNTRLDLARAFYHCHALITPPTLPDNVSNLNGAFSACYNLVTTPTIPNSVGSSLNSTFYDCSSLTTHTPLPDSATLLHSTFFNCTNITTIPDFSTNVRNLYETYYGCRNLTAIPNIPSNVTDMYHTFGACVNISGDINILSDKIVNVTNLFGETSARKNVYIPPVCYNDTSVNSPTYNAFIAAGYDNIGTKDGVYLMYNYAPALPSDWETTTAANGTIILEKYIGTNTTVTTPHNDWYSNKVLNTSTYIHPNGNGPFFNNINITEVDLSNVEVINNDLSYTFGYCSNIQTVTNINQNITNLSGTFYRCYALNTSPSIPQNTTNMYLTFGQCFSLTDMPAIPNSVINMASTFDNCNNLKNIADIPDSVIDMYDTFGACYNLTTAPNISNNVTNMMYTFQWCINLATVQSIPNSVIDMSSTFFSCYSLNNLPYINVPNCNNTYQTFINCNHLTDVNISAPNTLNITNIFYGCTNLTNIQVEFNSITNASELFKECKTLNTANIVIPNATNLCNAFYNCQTLNNLTISLDSAVDLGRTFYNCSNLKDVPDIPSSVTNLTETFRACNSLTDAPNIANGITSLRGTYIGCDNLVNVPKIPDSVQSMVNTFSSCIRLTNPPILSNNVSNLSSTFRWCNSLTTMPDLPSTVTNLYQTFSQCTSLVTTKTIPANVNNMFMTFYNCQKITGNIYIQSNKISYADNCFYSTSLIKNVYIPFEYENGVATQTYNSFIAAGYGTEDYLHGVHLKDIDGSKVTINPTPADAIVLMFNETRGTEIDENDLNKFSYTSISGDVEIQALNTTDTVIVVPSQWVETNRMRAPEGSIIHYRVYKDGYYPVESQVTVDGSQTIDVNLEQIMCTFTVAPMPIDATVTLSTPDTSYRYLYRWGWLYTEFPDLASVPADIKNGTAFRIYTATGETEYGYDSFWNTFDDSTGIEDGVEWVHFDGSGGHDKLYRDPTEDVVLTVPTYPQVGNSITVPWGTEVSYTVSKAHYTTVTGTEIVKTTGSRYVPLAIDKHTFTINPTPADAAVQILVNGRLVNASNSDWVFTANNANGDIELQEYIGSNTVVVMPTSYETTNTVTADYGSTIEWTVSRQGYHPRTGTLTLEQDTTLDIELAEITYGVDVSDYNYTLDNRVVTLTQYIGEGGNINTPEIEEI